MIITLNNGKILTPLDFEGVEGQDVYYTYTHHYNSKSQAERYIPSKFIRYVRGKRKAIIQRSDKVNVSRVPIGQIYKIKEVKRARTSSRRIYR